jgi:hypothetical protein
VSVQPLLDRARRRNQVPLRELALHQRMVGALMLRGGAMEVREPLQRLRLITGSGQ